MFLSWSTMMHWCCIFLITSIVVGLWCTAKLLSLASFLIASTWLLSQKISLAQCYDSVKKALASLTRVIGISSFWYPSILFSMTIFQPYLRKRRATNLPSSSEGSGRVAVRPTTHRAFIGIANSSMKKWSASSTMTTVLILVAASASWRPTTLLIWLFKHGWILVH